MTEEFEIKDFTKKRPEVLMAYIVNLVYEENKLLFWDEGDFWKDNITNYSHLYTYAVLNKLGGCMQSPIKEFSQKYYNKIIEQSKLFFNNCMTTNEEFKLFCKKTLFLDLFEYDSPKNLGDSDDPGLEIRLLKIEKSASETTDNLSYSDSYKYITTFGEHVEDLNYTDCSWYSLFSNRLEYTSRLKINKKAFSNEQIDDVISVAHTNNGFIYIQSKGGRNYIYGQGFTQCNLLNRQGKCPVYVKASGSRVAALMSDGTVTSNFCDTINGAIGMGFDENGKFWVKEKIVK